MQFSIFTVWDHIETTKHMILQKTLKQRSNVNEKKLEKFSFRTTFTASIQLIFYSFHFYFPFFLAMWTIRIFVSSVEFSLSVSMTESSIEAKILQKRRHFVFNKHKAIISFGIFLYSLSSLFVDFERRRTLNTFLMHSSVNVKPNQTKRTRSFSFTDGTECKSPLKQEHFNWIQFAHTSTET